jgi:L-alanine-DL-glutamate epimerase-like enolase superfamily enzyme
MKIKVGGVSLAEDLNRIDTAIEILGDSQSLAVDANAGLSNESCWEYASALAPYTLRWFEEPTDPLDFKLLSELAHTYAPAIATGENLFSTQDIQNLMRYAGLRAGKDILQVDIPQSYGITQFTKTLEVIQQYGWSPKQVFPHGGNMMTLAVVAGLDLGGCEAYPGVFGEFAGFSDDARVENGMITLTDRPGIGFEGQNQLYELMSNIFK